MNVLQQIFRDNFYKVADSGITIRSAVFDNVNRMLKCGDSSEGFSIYECPNCRKLKFVPFRCKSRFCTSCGNLYSIRRANNMSLKLIQCPHRHCVFTIPEELRVFFRKDRALLDCLFTAVRDVVLRMFYKINKSEDFRPGFICVLHTFGRSLQWNPHIHALISEGGIGNSSMWRRVTHFNFTLLRNSFRSALLNLMEKYIGPSFKKVKSYIYKNCPNGFYVYAKKTKCNAQQAAKYIGRYLGRPVIATSRILEYDGDFVTFKYNRHEDNKLIIEKVTAIEFIKKLIIHIPDRHFKMIRYYGIYARKHKHDSILIRAVSECHRAFIQKYNRWQHHIMFSFGFDPLLCECGTRMHCINSFHKAAPLSESQRYNYNSS